jgi:tetratricopeptide (TPR) repeat protein
MVGSKETTKQGPWLVKSGDRILGPYSTDDLGQLIREKEVVVIDEVMAPQSRWAYVRDVEAFQPVVEEIRRGLMHSREDTEVQGYTSPIRNDVSKPASSTSSTPAIDHNDPTHITQTQTTPDLGSMTAFKPKDSMSQNTFTSTATLGPSAAGVVSKKTPKATPPKPKYVPPPPVKLTMDPLPHHNQDAVKEANKDALATPQKQYVRPRMGGGKSGLIIGTFVLILAAGFIIYTVLKSPKTHTVANVDNLQTQASVAWKRGEFDRALELYRALNHDQPDQPLTAARLAILMMKIEGQTVEAKRVIDSAKINVKDDEQKSALAIASGLAELQNDDAKQAAIDFGQAGPSWIASFDAGVAFTLTKNWPEASRAFANAGENAVALLMLARTHLSAAESGSGRAVARREADESIKKALIQAPDYQQESLLVAAYVDSLTGNVKRANKEILEAVETDPNQTNDHFHDPALSLDQVSWSKLLPYCQGLSKSLNSRVSTAMMGLCLAKSNQLQEASRLVEAELIKEPSDTYLHAVNAYLHTLADRDDAARASLTLSIKNGNSRLAQILSARLCSREKQDACAEDAWSKLASETNPPIASIIGLAQLREQKGDTAAANALLVKAESMSPKYLPLLRLREDASR